MLWPRFIKDVLLFAIPFFVIWTGIELLTAPENLYKPRTYFAGIFIGVFAGAGQAYFDKRNRKTE